jgi:subtilisin-like proprotein convertase family protein
LLDFLTLEVHFYSLFMSITFLTEGESLPLRRPGRSNRSPSIRYRDFSRSIEFLESRVLLSALALANSRNSPSLLPPAVFAQSFGGFFEPIISRVVTSADGVVPHASSPSSSGYTPSRIRKAYGVDQIMFGNIVGDGTGQTIAIIDAYDYPTAFADLQTFDAQFGLPDPPSFMRVAQDGSTNYPSTDPNSPNTSTPTWEWEAALDIEWTHAMAPGANIILVEAASSGFSSMVQAGVNWARNQPGVSVISMSFGSSEFGGENTFDSYFTTPAGHPGVTFVASTGDNGNPGEYPSFSPNVVAVGGTSLFTDGAGNYSGESGWSGSGGGISQYESKPSYQSSVTASSTQRTIPDVAMDADPGTGVAVYDSYDFGAGNGWITVGGTSLAAPLFAGFVAITNQGRVAAGLPPLDGPSQTLPNLYNAPASDFHDVTTGSNGSTSAGPGYDLVTGLGTPVANNLTADLGQFASISGTVYQDNNGNGAYDAGETPMAGVTVFADSNNNGVLDLGGSSTVSSGTLNTAIPNGSTTGITSSVAVTGLTGLISDVNVTININHPRVHDLTVTLIGPDNTQVTLLTNLSTNAGANFANTTFDDQATTSISSGVGPFTGSFKPIGLLSSFNGKSPNGTWSLKVADTRPNSSSGSLVSWSVTVSTPSEVSTVTAADGTFHLVAPGSATTIRELVPAGYIASAPTSYQISGSGVRSSINFGNFPTSFTTTSANTAYYLWLDPTKTNVLLGTGGTAGSPPTPTYQFAISALPSLTFNLTAPGSSLIIDLVNGMPSPTGNIHVDGTGAAGNSLTIIGQSTAQQLALNDSQAGLASGGPNIQFSNLDTLSLVNATVYFSGSFTTLSEVSVANGALYWI